VYRVYQPEQGMSEPEVNATVCGGCAAWLAPLVASAQCGGRCQRQTVPLGAGCLLPRLHSQGEEAPRTGMPWDDDPNWRD
jgi:hypothetical protein